MRHTLLFIAIAISLLAASCAGDSRRALQKLEALEADAAIAPDSVLAELARINPDSLPDPASRALYALTTARARYEAYYDDSSDSTACIAIDYYSRHPQGANRQRLMMAHYLAAYIQAHTSRYSEAIVNFLEAECCAEAIADTLRLGLIYREMALVYDDIYAGAEGIAYAKKSARVLEPYSDKDYYCHSLDVLGRNYSNAGLYDSSLTVFSQLLADGHALGNTVAHEDALRGKAVALMGLGNYDSAAVYYERLYNLAPESFDNSDAYNLHRAYLYCRRADKIDSFGHIFANDSLMYPIEFAAAEGDYRTAYEGLLRLEKIRDRDLATILNQTVTSQVEGFRRQEIIKKQYQLKELRLRWCVSVLGCIIIIILLFAAYRRRERLQTERYSRLADRALELELAFSQSLHSASERERLLRSRISELFAERFRDIDRQCALYYESSADRPKACKKVIDELEHTLAKMSSPESLKRIEASVNEAYDNIVGRFDADFPAINSAYRTIFIFSVAGFSLKSISLLLDEDLRAIYNKVERLRVRIEQNPACDTKLYMSYLGGRKKKRT